MSTPPTYEQIRAELRRLLASGRYQVGDQLPTIRELTEQYNINGVQTVRSAYEALIDEGLVVARQGSGYFVAALPLHRLGLIGLAERASQARVDAERAAGQARALESELTDALTDHERVAVDALTAAARATVLTGGGEERRRDFGEIALQVLAGVAANLGGVENLLAGRPGSWEADIIRDAVNAIAPDDLLPHYRTEPLRITLSVDQILADRTNAYTQYDTAQDTILRRMAEAETTLPRIDEEQYAWVYDLHPDSDPTPRSADAPKWSWEAWRDGVRAIGTPDSQISSIETAARSDQMFFTSLLIPKSTQLAVEMWRLEDERDQKLATFDLEEELELQRVREWAEYGKALKQRIEQDAYLIPGLDVPVEVRIDTTGVVALDEGDDFTRNLIDTAVINTPTPADLPDTPLERLENARGV